MKGQGKGGMRVNRETEFKICTWRARLRGRGEGRAANLGVVWLNVHKWDYKGAISSPPPLFVVAPFQIVLQLTELRELGVA